VRRIEKSRCNKTNHANGQSHSIEPIADCGDPS
jgi:hypothetical protein